SSWLLTNWSGVRVPPGEPASCSLRVIFEAKHFVNHKSGGNARASGGSFNGIFETGGRQSNAAGGGRAQGQRAGEVCGGHRRAGHGLGEIAAQPDRLGKNQE